MSTDLYSQADFGALIDSNQRLVSSVESLVRANHGAPTEGNLGMLGRLEKVEKDHLRFRWLIPFALAGGTATGHAVSMLFFNQ